MIAVGNWIIGVVCALLLVGAVYAVLTGTKAVVESHSTPKYTVGTCLREANAEVWDHTYHIVMVGKNNYLARVTPFSLYRDQPGFTLSFQGGNAMVQVPCPKKGKQ